MKRREVKGREVKRREGRQRKAYLWSVLHRLNHSEQQLVLLRAMVLFARSGGLRVECDGKHVGRSKIQVSGRKIDHRRVKDQDASQERRRGRYLLAEWES